MNVCQAWEFAIDIKGIRKTTSSKKRNRKKRQSEFTTNIFHVESKGLYENHNT